MRTLARTLLSIPPFRVLRPLARRARSQARDLLAPRLGILRQYPPRRLALTAGRTRLPGTAPRVTIVTPAFNHAIWLERTLRSVLDQGYSNLEYIVQDGGSKDGTMAILERHASRLTAARSEPDSGQANAINRGFAGTTGTIMAYLNSDDLLLPGAIARVAAFFERHPEIDVVYGHRVLIDAEDCDIGRWVMPPHDAEVLRWCDFVPQETLFWRREIWERAGGGMDESFAFALDWDLLLRFQECGARFARLPYYLGAFRVHPTQKTMAQIGDVGAREMARLRERCHGREISHEEAFLRSVPYLKRHVYYHLASRLGLTRLVG